MRVDPRPPPTPIAQALGCYSQGRGIRQLAGGCGRNSGQTGLLGLWKEAKIGGDILLNLAGLGPPPLAPLTGTELPSSCEEEAERCSPAPGVPSAPCLSVGPRVPELPVFWRPKRLEKGASSGGWGGERSPLCRGSFPETSSVTPEGPHKPRLPSAPEAAAKKQTVGGRNSGN